MKTGWILIGLIIHCLGALASDRIVVAKDGTGHFQTVQQAIDAVPDNARSETVIYIKNGRYKEKITIPEPKGKIRMIGESVEGVVLTYDDFASRKDGAGNNIGTSGSASFFLFAPDFTAENITFENSAGPVGQAVAARITGDRATFINCRFLGFQDTLYTHGDSSRQYYSNCYIEGSVDFIFGAATAVFDSCTIYAKQQGYFTAASTPEGRPYGYVFRNCLLKGDGSKATFFLGRPWRPFAKTVFLFCHMDAVVKPEGWNNWGKKENEHTTLYAEYKNSGPGYLPDKRVGWASQLSDKEAANYTLSNIFNGWQPPAPAVAKSKSGG